MLSCSIFIAAVEAVVVIMVLFIVIVVVTGVAGGDDEAGLAVMLIMSLMTATVAAVKMDANFVFVYHKAARTREKYRKAFHSMFSLFSKMKDNLFQRSTNAWQEYRYVSTIPAPTCVCVCVCVYVCASVSVYGRGLSRAILD